MLTEGEKVNNLVTLDKKKSKKINIGVIVHGQQSTAQLNELQPF
jgi:hypothetical protein